MAKNDDDNEIGPGQRGRDFHNGQIFLVQPQFKIICIIVTNSVYRHTGNRLHWLLQHF